ncbi:hypothetical protein DV735_g2634, partial [Chaetothyriales sp. CBS 134920]
MSNNIIGNRNSTPVASKPSIRGPATRTIGTAAASALRSSADMTSFSSPRSIRPASEVVFSQQSQPGAQDDSNRLGEQWIQDIEQYETMLEEMAAATLDQDFKDELSAIEQWFKVLSEAERTAATYALIQQTTQMQQRFFAQVLNQMSKSHPISGVLSPTNFGEKDAMSSRLSDAMSKFNVEGSRHSVGRPPVSPAGNKRNSGLDQSTIHAMFPDAAAAIAQQKADYAQQTGNAPPSNRNSTIDRASLVAPSIQMPRDSKGESLSWRQNADPQQAPILRPKSSSGQPPTPSQPPMGQFSQSTASGGLRSPRPLAQVPGNIQSTTLSVPDHHDQPVLSPYNPGSWASMTNTPMVPNFGAQQSNAQSDMIANATAMKLAALSTVNNRIALDDVKKYRRGPIQAQQIAAAQGRRSRPSSPGIQMQGTPLSASFSSPQHNGYLAAYDSNPLILNQGLGGLMAPPPIGSFTDASGYLSDHSEMGRGRSPRGRRGSSKPPEDPADPALLQDIQAWLRSLRLHKYTDNLKDLKWEELVQLDDKALEARGVNALGARNKMLKVFEQVKSAQAEGKL